MFAVTSGLSLAECLVRPFELGRDDWVRVYRQALTSRRYLEIASIDTDVLISAARLRSEIKLKMPDAIHAATAIAGCCTAMLTNDGGFYRVRQVQLFLLSDWIAR